MPDVVVAGGGILGASAAWHLAHAGAEVTLVEREPALGTQTTAAGAGFVGYWAGELEAELAEYGMSFYAGLQERAGEDIGVRRVGLMFPAVTPEGVEMLRQEYERELAFAPGVELLDADETVRRAPILARDAVHGSLLQPDAHQVDTVRAMGALRAELAQLGVELRTGVEAREATVAGGRVTGLTTSAGHIPAATVVNAAGAGARALGARNGIDIAAVPLPESRFTTAPVPGVTRDLPMMLFFERDLLYIREADGGLLVGAIEKTLGDGAAHDHEPLARELANVVPALAAAEIRERRTGHPTWTPDGRHILGPAPGLDGYLVLAGCNESGVTHGPGLGRIAAALATGGPAPDISAYRVGRFGPLAPAAAQEAAERQYLLRHPPAPGVAATPFGIEIAT